MSSYSMIEFEEKIRVLCLYYVPSNWENKSFLTGEGDSKYYGCFLDVFDTPVGAVSNEQEYGDMSSPERMSSYANLLCLDIFLWGVVGSLLMI